jgi:hypothetical protein
MINARHATDVNDTHDTNDTSHGHRASVTWASSIPSWGYDPDAIHRDAPEVVAALAKSPPLLRTASASNFARTSPLPSSTKKKNSSDISTNESPPPLRRASTGLPGRTRAANTKPLPPLPSPPPPPSNVVAKADNKPSNLNDNGSGYGKNSNTGVRTQQTSSMTQRRHVGQPSTTPVGHGRRGSTGAIFTISPTTSPTTQRSPRATTVATSGSGRSQSNRLTVPTKSQSSTTTKSPLRSHIRSQSHHTVQHDWSPSALREPIPFDELDDPTHDTTATGTTRPTSPIFD